MSRHHHLGAAILAAATLGVPAMTTPANAAPVIQPGIEIVTGSSQCTLNWIYDGTGARAGSVYGGTAAHCVNAVGNVVTTGGVRIGTVAYISPVLDTALILIDAANEVGVIAALKGHPEIPTGVSTSNRLGDIIQFSGYGVATRASNITREERQGVLIDNVGCHHRVDGVVSPGDSGGPVADVTDGNKALGIVNTVGVSFSNGKPHVGEAGVSVTCVLSDAASRGFPIALRTI